MNYNKKIFKLGFPIMLGSILQILMNTMDMFFISRLGTDHAAASAMATSIAGVVFVFTMLIATGATSKVAIATGSNDRQAMLRYSSTTLMLAFIIGLLLTGITYFNAESIINIYDPQPVVTSYILEYLKIIFLFTVVVFLNATLRSIIQSTGDTTSPLYVFGGANILNILLDYIFIVKLGYGIEGAAYATVLSQTIACLVLLYIFITRYYQTLRSFAASIRFRLDEIVEILKIGLWAAIQSIARPITGLIMMRIVYEAGQSVGGAGFGIGLTLVNYFFIILTGLASATTILVGQCIGSDDVKSISCISRSAKRLSVVNFLVFLIPFMLIPSYLFIPFKAAPEVVAVGVNYLRIIMVSFPFVGFTFIYRGMFAASGKTFYPMTAALVSNVLVKTSFAYVAVMYLDWGLNGIWIAISISVVLEFLIIKYAYSKKGIFHELTSNIV